MKYTSSWVVFNLEIIFRNWGSGGDVLVVALGGDGLFLIGIGEICSVCVPPASILML